MSEFSGYKSVCLLSFCASSVFRKQLDDINELKIACSSFQMNFSNMLREEYENQLYYQVNLLD